jgi:diguanylate cyclase (GGDEF)-like protein/PAS domain S-box-containing protein
VAAILAACAFLAPFAAWPDAVANVASESYLPHGFCYFWNPRLLTLHVVSDSIIFTAYTAISFWLAWFAYRERHRVPFAWMFVAFGVFILACGCTHAMEVVVLWRPLYWLSGDLKLFTAVSSLSAATILPFVMASLRKMVETAHASRRNERRFLAASDTSHDSFCILESVRDDRGAIVDFRFAFVNAKGAELVRRTPQTLTGRLLCEELPMHRESGLFDRYVRVVKTGTALEDEFSVEQTGFDAAWLHTRVVKLDDGIAITHTDISERKENELRLSRLATFLQSIIASSPFATIVTDLSGTITSVNPAAESMLGYSKEDLINRQTPLVLLDPLEVFERALTLSEELHERVEPGMAVLTANRTHDFVVEGEWTFVRRDGSRFDAQMTVSSLTDQSGTAVGLIMLAYDITERKRTEAYISHLAHHDALTGLPTRTLLRRRLDGALAHAEESRSCVGLLMIDLDNFKRVNDLIGHHAGDALLREVAVRLGDSVRACDTVARIGGDEFVVVLDGIGNAYEAEDIARRLLANVSVPLELGEQTISPTASVGICVYPECADAAESLLKNADAAMYRAKAEGRNTFATFTYDMAFASSRRRMLEAGLDLALERNELHLLYQPQICIKTGRITGFEALLRWQSGELGSVMPNDFISLIEESGLIAPIGEWVLRTACREGRRLQEEMGRAFTIAVNISPVQLQQEALPEIVSHALADCGLNAGSLELEITENVLVSTSTRTRANLDAMRSLGVRVAIDDFGTGFSSMSYVTRFPVDRLKIDRSFVADMLFNSTSNAVTSAVITLAADLNISVVAEGVETAEHRDSLLGKGCTEAQGFFYSRPVPIESLSSVIRRIEASQTAFTMTG